MEDGELPQFSALARRGVRAAYAQVVDPPLTFPVHNSLASGSLPARTGIVSNTYHEPRDNFYWYREAFEEPMGAAEPVWVTASRAGLSTATLLFPGGVTSIPDQMADYTVDYGVRDAYSRQVTLPLAPAADLQDTPTSFSPALQGDYHIPDVGWVRLLAADSTDDGVHNYDTLLLCPDHDGLGLGACVSDQETLHLKVGEWGPLVLEPQLAAGADFLLQEITAEEVTFYHTGVHHNRAAPRELLEGLNARFGFFPSGADAYALEHGWITEEDYLHEIERQSAWVAAVAAWMVSDYDPDLLFAWQENFDAAGHAFFLTDPRQEGYSSERARLYADYYRRAAYLADSALARMLEPVDLDRAAVFLVADHGMTPAHTRVYVNTLLERAGLLVLDRKDYVVVEQSRALAVASGGAVNIYLNLEGRETGGIVPAGDAVDLQAQIVSLLSGLADPNTGEPVFQRVLPRAELASLGLDLPHSGDVFAQAHPGYFLDGFRGMDDIFVPSTVYGQHGYDSRLPEMRALFIAAGAGLPQQEAAIPPVSILDIAPTLAALLGFDSAPTIDGQPIQTLLNR
jgi:predicted AlkP superfamily pyrophosphatase or phosphodiesterase